MFTFATEPQSVSQSAADTFKLLGNTITKLWPAWLVMILALIGCGLMGIIMALILSLKMPLITMPIGFLIGLAGILLVSFASYYLLYLMHQLGMHQPIDYRYSAKLIAKKTPKVFFTIMVSLIALVIVPIFVCFLPALFSLGIAIVHGGTSSPAGPQLFTNTTIVLTSISFILGLCVFWYVLISAIFIKPFALLENHGPLATIKSALTLAKGQRWRTFFLLLIIGLIFNIFAIPLMLAIVWPLTVAKLAWVGDMLTLPIKLLGLILINSMILVAYNDLKLRKIKKGEA